MIIALLIITTKISKTIELLRKLQNILSRPLLMTIYKAFVRPHLEYGDITYDEAYKKNSIRNLEIFKRKLLPRIRLGIPPTSMLVQKSSFILKMFKGSKLVFIFNLIPTKSLDYNTKNTDKITLFHTKHNFFKIYFSPPTVTEWNKLNPNLDQNTSKYSESILFVWPWCWNKYAFFSSQPLFNNKNRTLLSTVNDADSCLTNTNDLNLSRILLFSKMC